MMTWNVTYKELLARWMEDPEFREEYTKLAAGSEVRLARIMAGLTQQELAERIGTKQSSVSRLECGRQEPGMEMLRKIAWALDCELRVRLFPR